MNELLVALVAGASALAVHPRTPGRAPEPAETPPVGCTVKWAPAPG